MKPVTFAELAALPEGNIYSTVHPSGVAGMYRKGKTTRDAQGNRIQVRSLTSRTDLTLWEVASVTGAIASIWEADDIRELEEFLIDAMCVRRHP